MSRKAESKNEVDDIDSVDELNPTPSKVGVDSMKQGDEKCAPGFMKSIFGGSSRFDEAAELYERAAGAFKANRNWDLAAQAFLKLAELNENHLKDNNAAASNYMNAARMFKRYELSSSVKYFELSATMMREANRLSAAAKCMREAAELFEADHQPKEAQRFWKQAASDFDAEGQPATAAQCWTALADNYALNKEYQKAATLYKKTATKMMSSNTGKWNARDILCKALLCHFIILSATGDMDALQQLIEEYKDICPNMDGTRECKLIEQLQKAFADDDEPAFEQLVFRHDEIYKLDKFWAKCLFAVKNNFGSAGGAGGGMEELDGEPDIS